MSIPIENFQNFNDSVEVSYAKKKKKFFCLARDYLVTDLNIVILGIKLKRQRDGGKKLMKTRAKKLEK